MSQAGVVHLLGSNVYIRRLNENIVGRVEREGRASDFFAGRQVAYSYVVQKKSVVGVLSSAWVIDH